MMPQMPLILPVGLVKRALRLSSLSNLKPCFLVSLSFSLLSLRWLENISLCRQGYDDVMTSFCDVVVGRDAQTGTLELTFSTFVVGDQR